MADVPKIVIRRLASRAAQAGKPELHPDANLLTAFAEQSLGSHDRLQVLDHLAQCFECREIVSLAVPELVDAKVVPRSVSAPWLSWPVLRWGAAIACVVVVGAAVALREREAREVRSVEKGAAAVGALPASSPQREAAQSVGSSMASGSTGNIELAQQAPSQKAMTTPIPGSKAEAGAQVEVEGAAQAAKPSERKAAVADLMARAAKDSVIPGRAKDDLAEAQPSSGNSGMAGAVALASPAALVAASQLPRSSPMRVPRWTLSADGMLQRSLDMGRSWESITVSLEASLRALAANGFDIWVGGTAGALYHSEDAGEHWMKVQAIANGQPLTADIIGVEFPDPGHGRLNTASGEVWTTEDAGLTWQRQ